MIVNLKVLCSEAGAASRRAYFEWLTVFWVYALLWLITIFVVNVMWSASPIWKLLYSSHITDNRRIE